MGSSRRQYRERWHSKSAAVVCAKMGFIIGIGHASIVRPATPGLRQRERDRANGEKRKQNERAPEKMRLNGGINLFFHLGAFVTLGARRSRSRSAHLVVAYSRSRRRPATHCTSLYLICLIGFKQNSYDFLGLTDPPPREPYGVAGE